MAGFEEKQQNRLKMLHALYEVTNGNSARIVSMWDLGARLGFDRTTTGEICQYLTAEGLMEGRSLGGGVGISHLGVKEVEDALANPGRPTDHFPASVVNIIHVHSMHNSQIQQGSHGATQSLHVTPEQKAKLSEHLPALKQAMSALPLPAVERNEVNSEIATLEAQAESPKPKTNIIKECFASLRKIAESAVGGVAARGIFENLDDFAF